MSFRCTSCGQPQEDGVKPNREILQMRRKEYPPRPAAGDPGGVGMEIVREGNFCVTCLELAAGSLK